MTLNKPKIFQDIDNINTQLGEKANQFDTVNLMISANLKDGDFCITKGFHTKNDGGGASYRISSTIESYYTLSYTYGSEDPYGAVIKLDNGKYALLHITDNKVNLKQLGAYGDDFTGTGHDDTKVFQFVESTLLFFTLKIPSGFYKTTDPLEIGITSYKEVIGSSSYYAADNYHLCTSKICYYPQSSNTIAVTVSGTGSKFKDMAIQIMDYTKQTTGFLSRIDMGIVENIQIIDSDYIGYVIGGRYGRINNISISDTNAHVTYVGGDFANRSLYAYAVCDDANRSAGYVPTNQYIEGLRMGSPTFFVAQNGIIINGISLIFDNMFNPSCATTPITFGDSALGCEIRNSYMEYNSLGSYPYHIIFTSLSKGNKVKGLYISDNLRVNDSGWLNTYETMTYLTNLPVVNNFKNNKNLYNLEFKDNGSGGCLVADRLGNDLTSATSYDNKYNYCALTGSVARFSKNSVTLNAGTNFNLGLRIILNHSKEMSSLKGKSVLIGCKYSLSSNSDININNVIVTNSYGTFYNKNSISAVVKLDVTTTNYYFATLFKCTSPGTVGTITFYDFFIYSVDTTEIAVNQKPDFEVMGNYLISDSVVLHDTNSVPYRINVGTDGTLSTTKLYRVNVSAGIGVVFIPITSLFVASGGSFTFRLDIQSGYNPATLSITNVAYTDNGDGSYTITNITANKVILISISAS